MGAHETKTFKSGNSVAVRLPKSLGMPADEPITIDQQDGVITIRRSRDAAEAKRQLLQMLDDMEKIGCPADGVQPREQWDWPDRPGLYGDYHG